MHGETLKYNPSNYLLMKVKQKHWFACILHWLRSFLNTVLHDQAQVRLARSGYVCFTYQY